MSLIAYEIDINWFPEPDNVNSRTGIEFTGWRIGINTVGGLGLWVFDGVDPESSRNVLDDVLPDEYNIITIDDDLAKYGYVRTMLPQSSIVEVEEAFNTNKDFITEEVVNGER